MRLKDHARTKLLARALADAPQVGPHMAIPGKDHGFDIDGLGLRDLGFSGDDLDRAAGSWRPVAV